jgi:hypothetical protein
MCCHNKETVNAEFLMSAELTLPLYVWAEQFNPVPLSVHSLVMSVSIFRLTYVVYCVSLPGAERLALSVCLSVRMIGDE